MSNISAQHYGKTNKRGYYKYHDLLDFRLWLIENGANKSNMTYFLRGVTEFRKTGLEINDETIKNFRDQMEENGVNYRYSAQMANGVRYYKHFLNGESLPKRISKTFECNEDCFNCIYSDCLIPDYLIHVRSEEAV